MFGKQEISFQSKLKREANGSANPFVVVRCGNIVKQTQVRSKTLNPLFDKIFNFEFQDLKKSELETLKISIEVRDRTFFYVPYLHNHLGGYEIDMTSVYFNLNHMYDKTWFTLFDFDEEFEGCMGFVKATIEVLGPDDEPTITEGITDDPSVEKTVISSKIKPKGHLIMAEIYKAEFLTPVGVLSRKLDPYINIKYGGMSKQTKKLRDTSNPEFNQIVLLQAVLPNHSKHIFVELWHDAFLADSLIGTAIIPFNKFKNSNNQKPEWINIYGPSISSNNEYTQIMAKNGYKTGTAFRGRILIRFSSRDEEKPVSDVIRMNYRIPEMIIPNPLTKAYTLRIDLFEGSVLPSNTRGILHLQLGNYFIKSQLRNVDENKSIFWNQSIEDRRIILPMDINQIPDMIIYFCDEDVESRRISYFRISAKKIIVKDSKTYKEAAKPLILKFREDKSHKLLKSDHFPGFAVARIMLYNYTPPPRKENRIILTNEIKKKKFKLLLFIYVARQLASGEEDGTSNPQVEFKSGGKIVKTTRIDNTLNPDWYERRILDIEINDVEYTQSPTVTIMVNHIKTKNGKEVGKSLLGRYWLLLDIKSDKTFILNRKTKEEIKNITYFKPQWIPLIYDKEDKLDGKLLLGYAVIPEKHFSKIRKIYDNFDHILPKNEAEDLRLYAFGIRDLKKYNKKLPKAVSFRMKINSVITNPNNEEEIIEKKKPLDDEEELDKMLRKEFKTKTVEISNKGLQFNDQVDFLIRVPVIKELCPIMEIYVYEDKNGKEKLIGIGHYPLFKPLAYFYGEEDDKDYVAKWNEFFILDKIGVKENEEKGTKNLKLQRFKPENKMLYFENYVYVINDPVGIHNKKYIKAAQNAITVKTDGGKEMRFLTGGEGESPYAEYEKQPMVSRKDLRIKMDVLQEEQLDKEKMLITGSKRDFMEDKIEVGQKIGEDETDMKETKNDRIDTVRNEIDKLIQEKDSHMPENPEDQIGVSIGNSKSGYEKISQKAELDPLFNPFKAIAEKNEMKIERDNVKGLIMDDVANYNDEDVKKLYLNINQDAMADLNSDIFENKELSNFEIDSEDNIGTRSNELSVKNLQYNELFVEENKDAKRKRKQAAIHSFMKRFKGKNLLKSLFKKDKDKQVTYQDYDTDEDEDYDDTLPYLKGRREFQDDLEDKIFIGGYTAVNSVEIFSGNQRQNDSIFRTISNKQSIVGNFKFLFVRANRPDLVSPNKISDFLRKVTRPRDYIARVYILRGLQITSINDNDNPKTYLKFIYNHDQVEVDKDSTREGLYPEYYRTKSFYINELPGTAKLRIEIWEQTLIGGVFGNEILGYTEIDLEERHFSIKWNTMEKKPVEKRNIKNDLLGSRGRLEMWIDILPAKTKEPFTVIYPKLQMPYELRVIVWETKDCVFKDEITKANDLFARGGVKRGDTFLETDTHWRCRNKGSFNWRWKFEINLPVDENKNYGEDKFMIQLWDRDIIARNDLIGEFEIDLDMHKMLKKANIRKKAVEMRLREEGTGNETNMLWFNVYHPEKLDADGNKVTQGKVMLSFEAMPKDLTEKFKNELGRAQPNFFPTLPQPVGRFSFDLLSPWKTLKGILGPELCYKIVYYCCCIIWIIIFILIAYYVIPNMIGYSLSQLINTG